MTDKESAIYATGYWNGIASKKLRELTDEKILDLCPPNHSEMMNEAYTIDFARAIEAYLKSKI